MGTRLVLATLLLSATVGTLEAQLSGNASLAFQSTPRKMRAEGLSEVAGDILLQSSQASAALSTGATAASAAISIYFNTSLSNKAQSSSAPLVNNNGVVSSTGIQVTLSNFTFASGTTTASWIASGNALTITLQLAANSKLVFGSGSNTAGIVVKGVRVNANVIGASSSSFVSQVYCAVLASGTGLTITGPTVQSSGLIAPALVGGGASSASLAQFSRSAAGSGQVTLVAAEGFSGAFTTAAQETAASGSEVTNGTRLDIALVNAPVGMSAQVYQVVQTPNLTLTLISNGSPISNPVPGATSAVTFSSGAAIVSYEATAATPNGVSASAIQIPLLLTLTQSGISFTVPGISLSLSPTSFSSSPNGPIPRFAPTGVVHNLSAILLSQSDYVFTTVEGNSTPMLQSLQVLGIGLGQFNWKIQSSVTTASWLSVDTSSGTTGLDLSSAVSVGVIANPSGLKVGDYYGLLAVSSTGAANSPQYVTVRLRITSAASASQADVIPGGLMFNALAGGAASGQNLVIRNVGGGSLTYTIAVTGGSWLTATPASGTAVAQGSSVTVTANPSGLAAGSYAGSVNLTFSDGSTRQVGVNLVVAPAPAVEALALRPSPAATCMPASLLAVSNSVANQFVSPVGWPLQLRVQVSDNCNNPILSAIVIASTPDGPVTLKSLNTGFYVGSYTPATAQSSKITINVANPPLAPTSIQLNGQFSGIDAASPRVSVPVNAASYATTPVAAGSIASVFGVNMAATPSGVSLPLPLILGGTSVIIGGYNAPFFYTSPTQLNVQLPQELAGMASASMVVTQDAKASSPQTVVLAPAQPGLFFYTQNGVSRGAILDAQYRPVDSSNPAAAGSVIQIFGAGFGATTPSVATGVVAPLDPVAKISNSLLEAVIGNSTASIQFAGLAPGLVGLYQFNVVVPPGLTPGDVPLTISANGVASNVVMLAVK